MTLPTTYLYTLLAAIFGMLCLGSWINGLKLAKRWRFELFYFDFAMGLLVAAVAAAVTLGSMGSDGFTFLDDLMRAGKRNMAFGVAAGIVFNLGNMILVGVTGLVGMSIAFPAAMALALLISSLLAYLATPQGNPTLLFTGLAMVAASLVFSILSYRSKALSKEIERMKAGQHRTLRPSVPWKGTLLSLVAGILFSVSAPLVSLATEADIGVGPYSLVVLFGVGILFSTVVYNLYFMNLPIQGRPVEIPEYFRGTVRHHALGLVSGAVWAAGTIAWQVITYSAQGASTSPGVALAILQSAPILAAFWGVMAWNEAKESDARGISFLVLMLFLFLAGLATLALAQFPGF